jgi:hypothetical protein
VTVCRLWLNYHRSMYLNDERNSFCSYSWQNKFVKCRFSYVSIAYYSHLALNVIANDMQHVSTIIEWPCRQFGLVCEEVFSISTEVIFRNTLFHDAVKLGTSEKL